jgi:Matrixin
MRCNVRRLAAVAAVAMALPLLGAIPAAAHWSGYDSVVNNKIDYQDNTDFDDVRNWARDQWNNSGDVDIQLDGSLTKIDVEFYDTDKSWVGWAGAYYYEPGDDDIVFNRHYMDGYTTVKRRFVAMHELGHALGLAHSYTGQVMQESVLENYPDDPPQYVQPHDQYSYDQLWG